MTVVQSFVIICELTERIKLIGLRIIRARNYCTKELCIKLKVDRPSQDGHETVDIDSEDSEEVAEGQRVTFLRLMLVREVAVEHGRVL